MKIKLLYQGQCPAYIGCYDDSSLRDLNGLGDYLINKEAGGSVETCVAYCSLKGFLFAGLQYK